MKLSCQKRMITSVLPSSILTVPRKTVLFTIKLAEQWLTSIVKLREVMRMELAQVVVEILGMVDPMEDMVRAAMNQNTNVIGLMKLNAILHHVLFHRIIVRTGKRKYVKS